MPNLLMPDSKHRVVCCTADHLAQLDSVRSSFPLILDALRPLHESSAREHSEFMRQSRDANAEYPSNRAPRHAMPLSKTTQYLEITRDYENTSRAMRTIPQGMLVAMVSQHDAFTGQ